jgi:hypothetical protein
VGPQRGQCSLGAVDEEDRGGPPGPAQPRQRVEDAVGIGLFSTEIPVSATRAVDGLDRQVLGRLDLGGPGLADRAGLQQKGDRMPAGRAGAGELVGSAIGPAYGY